MPTAAWLSFWKTLKRPGSNSHANRDRIEHSSYAPPEVLTHLLRASTGLPADKAYEQLIELALGCTSPLP